MKIYCLLQDLVLYLHLNYILTLAAQHSELCATNYIASRLYNLPITTKNKCQVFESGVIRMYRKGFS